MEVSFSIVLYLRLAYPIEQQRRSRTYTFTEVKAATEHKFKKIRLFISVRMYQCLSVLLSNR
jgi:hypothetical protein